MYVDATLGYAGHSKEILKRIKKGKLFAFDADSEAINYSHQLLKSISSNFKIIHSNFKYLNEKLDEESVGLVDGFLFDLGLSSPEIDDADRGFSFMKDAPLDELIEISHEDPEWVKKHTGYSKREQRMDSLMYAEEYRVQYSDVLRLMERMCG